MWAGLQGWQPSLAASGATDWITSAAYLVAAAFVWRAAAAASLRREGRDGIFWRVTLALMLFLGVNELFELQSAVTSVGRSLALSQGWYEQRRVYQAEFIAVLALLALVAGVAMLTLIRGSRLSVRFALVGLVFIGSFVLIRAASFHRVDRMLGMGPNDFDFGWMQKMAGIIVVGLAAHFYAATGTRKRRRRRR